MSVKSHRWIMLIEMGFGNMQIMIMELAGVYLMLVKVEVEFIKTGQSRNFRNNGVMIKEMKFGIGMSVLLSKGR